MSNRRITIRGDSTDIVASSRPSFIVAVKNFQYFHLGKHIAPIVII